MNNIRQPLDWQARWKAAGWQWLPLGAMLLFLAMFPYHSLQRGIWIDEFFTATYAQHPTIGMVLEDVRRNEETPPLYFLLVWLWGKGVGTSEVMLRLPSLVFGVLAVGLAVFLVQRWLTNAEARIFAYVMALSPLIARYSTEARVYTLLVLATIGCMAIFEYLYRHPDHMLLMVTYAIIAAMTFLISYLSVAILIAHNLIWITTLFRDRSQWKKRFFSWLAIQLAIGVLVFPWLPSLLYQIRVAPDVTLPHEFGFIHLLLLALALVAYTGKPITMLAILLFATCWSTFFYGVIQGIKNNRYRGLVFRIIIVPMLTTIGLLLILKVASPRYAMTMIPGIAIGIAIGCYAIHQQFPKIGRMGDAIVSLLLLYRLPQVILPDPISNPWNAIAQVVAQRAHLPDAVVVVHPPFEYRAFDYYYNGPDIPILGARDYDEFYVVQNHDMATAWREEEILEKIRDYQYVWFCFNSFFRREKPLFSSYQLIGYWKAEPLELFLYKKRLSPDDQPGIPDRTIAP